MDLNSDVENENELRMTDFLDIKVLQRIQDAFSELTGMAAIVADTDGKMITEASNFTKFCMMSRGSSVGGIRCEWCDKFGAQQTMESGKATTYFCHVGLIDFAAPIMVNGKWIGCFVGGQVLTRKLDLERVRWMAQEMEVDPDEFVEAVQNVKILPKETVNRAADFLQQITEVLSDIAYASYLTRQANEEIERAAKMKSDFLANMSHEIRTPMNAVIGMAEMALREDLPDAARGYIQQIKSSGRELLTIINDILDFSKIESGKMEIVDAEYEPMSVINDIVNVIMTRLRNKNVELLIRLDPDIPRTLWGDNVRVKQVLTNIANNAAKFTSEGKITISMGFSRESDEMAEMRVSVEDTGIGIRKQDMDKLFQSFQQVDSKRNRNVEGTGLGLAISKKLLTLMDGDISVESEYGKGSCFSFTFRQKIIDDAPSIRLEDADKKAVFCRMEEGYVREQLGDDCKVLGVECLDVATPEEAAKAVRSSGERELFFLIDAPLFSEEWEQFAKDFPDQKIVQVIPFFDTRTCSLPNLFTIKKPIYALNLYAMLSGESLMMGEGKEDDFDFIAPDAEVLIVDDNAVNLSIAEGLLEPLKMKIQTALSGKEAIERISDHKFDIIFMDHMMPEMDGIETTRIIRRFHEEYNEIPIIALSANAVGGTREMFLSEGMNDFVSKPIEVGALIAKVKQWLPVEKIQRIEKSERPPEEEKPAGEVKVADLDTETAIRLLGGEKMFWTILEAYYKQIEKKADAIQELFEKEDWAGYTIEVHALKSLSKQVGAMELSDMAAEMEKSGNARDVDSIKKNTGPLLERYRAYITALGPYFAKDGEEEEREPATAEALRAAFSRLREANENLDMDQMDEVHDELEGYSYKDEWKELSERLISAIEDMDSDACEEAMGEWEGLL